MSSTSAPFPKQPNKAKKAFLRFTSNYKQLSKIIKQGNLFEYNTEPVFSSFLHSLITTRQNFDDFDDLIPKYSELAPYRTFTPALQSSF